MNFTTELVAALSAADRAVGQLAGIMGSMRNPRLLIRSFIRREAVLSSRIEGTQATLSDLLLFELSPNGEPSAPDVREVANYVTALNHGVERLRQIPITLNLIRDLHRLLMEGVRGADRHPGVFRTCQNWIGPSRCAIEDATYVPPPPDRTLAALNALERFINTPGGLPILVQVAMAHYQFEAIHPFEDGNGRVGRLLISLMLDSVRVLPDPVLYLSAYFQEHQQAYYRHLAEISRSGAWEEWLVFVLSGITSQSIDAVERVRHMVELRDEWAERCQTARTSALLLKLLDHLFGTPMVNLASVRGLLRTGPQSAQAAIDKLIALGILTEITGHQRNRVYVARDVVAILDQTPAFDIPSRSQSAGRPLTREGAPR